MLHGGVTSTQVPEPSAASRNTTALQTYESPILNGSGFRIDPNTLSVSTASNPHTPREVEEKLCEKNAVVPFFEDKLFVDRSFSSKLADQ